MGGAAALLFIPVVAFYLMRPVEASVAASWRGDAAEVVYASGVVEPRTWAKVASLQRKRIIDLCRCEGKAVSKGDILAKLDDVEERAQLAELTARRDRLKMDVERARTLLERNVGSRVTLDEKVTQMQEAEARIAAQQDRIFDLVLRAPMDGIVLRQDGEVGEIAGTGSSDVLFWVGQPKPLRVVADVNEEDIVRVAQGQKVLLRHDGARGVALSAVVDEVTPKGDPASKTFRVSFALPDDTPLRIGMSVEANIVAREAKGVMLVPADAVREGRLAVVEGGRVRWRKVETGIRGGRAIEILSPMAAGAQVVSPARPELKEGARVRTRQEQRP